MKQVPWCFCVPEPVSTVTSGACQTLLRGHCAQGDTVLVCSMDVKAANVLLGYAPVLARHLHLPGSAG